MRDLPRLVAQASRDKNAAVSVWRNGKIIEIQTDLETLETVAQATEQNSVEPVEEPLGLYLSDRDPKTSDVGGNPTTMYRSPSIFLLKTGIPFPFNLNCLPC